MLGTLLLTAILVTAVFAYTNAIGGFSSVPVVASGDADMTGVFTVADKGVVWQSAGGNEVTGVAVTFDTASPTLAVARVSLDDTNWYSTEGTGAPCTISAKTVTCAWTAVEAADVDHLYLYASQ
ncbi:MAG: hypothetical protein WBQ14_03950 [Gaiellaceae bacterium]